MARSCGMSQIHRGGPYREPADWPVEAARSVAFTADGRTVASSGDEGRTVLWTTSDPAEPRLVGMPIESGNSALSAIVIGPGGRTAAVSTANRSVAMFPNRPSAADRPVVDPAG